MANKQPFQHYKQVPFMSFVIPNLPIPVYTRLSEIRKKYAMTAWQAIILAVRALDHMDTDAPEATLREATAIKERHPARGHKTEAPDGGGHTDG